MTVVGGVQYLAMLGRLDWTLDSEERNFFVASIR